MNSYNVVLIEDDEIDVINIERAFRKANICNPLFKCKDGIDGLELLRSGKISKPILILLDINMPRMNGLEFLAEIRKDKALGTVPVVILTSSRNDNDIFTAYKHHIAGYLVKPIGFDQFVEIMATIGKYWNLCEI